MARIMSLDKAVGIPEIFEIAKNIAAKHLGTYQAGLLVAISDLGAYGQGFVGAYYSLYANTIVINKVPLDTVKANSPELYKPYVLMILLHEYVHSLGFQDEQEVRDIVYELLKAELGEEHLSTRIAGSLGEFLPKITLGLVKEPDNLAIEYLTGIDRSNTGYIL